ncbi:hypothetical protein [Ruegeria sp. HKCCD6109]|uniref:hypothetical protein n=1 Tax=Ruegeria sp. HKCCD6109 TaxID=2683017 RepID=UPI00149210A4|nr:hypothetical protein [Ruegeria sp. HKCCD6109]NOD65764.1 hypothetical protein [Ruegeria sp. HKCCD6109]
MNRLPTPAEWDAKKVGPRQEISWQAEVLKSPEGTNLSTFLTAIARRFGHRDLSLSKHESYKLALDAVKGMGVPFGHPDYDWSRASAIDIADEEMTYWDECADGSNS